MSTELVWLGHGCWLIETGKDRILLDPFLDDSPTATVKSTEVSANYILVSHGHMDHVGDAVSIAKRLGATVISNFEICQWCGTQGVEHTRPHNLGGGSQFSFGRVEFTIAHHSSSLPDGSYGGNPCGFLLKLAEGTVYFACDTALFYDMQLIGDRGIDLAVVPIGDVFTMGVDESLRAINLIRPKRVAPSHYNTWPPIAVDVELWSHRVRSETKAEPRVLEVGGRIVL